MKTYLLPLFTLCTVASAHVWDHWDLFDHPKRFITAYGIPMAAGITTYIIGFNNHDHTCTTAGAAVFASSFNAMVIHGAYGTWRFDNRNRVHPAIPSTQPAVPVAHASATQRLQYSRRTNMNMRYVFIMLLPFATQHVYASAQQRNVRWCPSDEEIRGTYIMSNLLAACTCIASTGCYIGSPCSPCCRCCFLGYGAPLTIMFTGAAVCITCGSEACIAARNNLSCPRPSCPPRMSWLRCCPPRAPRRIEMSDSYIQLSRGTT